MVLGLCQILVTGPVCFYFKYVNNKPQGPTSQHENQNIFDNLLPSGVSVLPAQGTALLNSSKVKKKIT